MKVKERASHSGLGLSERGERCYFAEVSLLVGMQPEARLRTRKPEGSSQPWREQWFMGSYVNLSTLVPMYNDTSYFNFTQQRLILI